MGERFFQYTFSSMDIERAIDDISSFEEFERRFSFEMLGFDHRVPQCINRLLVKYDKSARQVSLDAGFSESYVTNILNDVNKTPSRDTLIKIAISAGATFDELQELLKISGNQPLYVRRKRDVIIWFGVKKGQSVSDIDMVLYNHELPLLQNEVK